MESIRRGVVTTTLDWGKCPRWLFERMVKLSSLIMEVMVDIHGPAKTIEIISHPVWFQSFGTFLGFDWNASGLTTTLTAAIKEVLKIRYQEYNIMMFGGKGKSALNTINEIKEFQDKAGWNSLVNIDKISRLTAKVDNSLIQDGFSLYHHTLLISRDGTWAVVQQGMNTKHCLARRYHWFNAPLNKFLEDPHTFIFSTITLDNVLNLAAKESRENREAILDLISHPLHSVLSEINKLAKTSRTIATQRKGNFLFCVLSHKDFAFNPVLKENIFDNHYLKKFLYENCGQKMDFLSMIIKEGAGAQTIRALSLAAELIYGAEPSFKDPARYSYAHGGKDGIPFPVNKELYDATIEIIKRKLQISSLSKLQVKVK